MNSSSLLGAGQRVGLVGQREKRRPIPAFDPLTIAAIKKGPEVIPTFSALDWLARLSAHISDKWAPMLRYYGGYSNRPHGERKPAQKGLAESVPVPDPESESDFKKEADHTGPG